MNYASALRTAAPAAELATVNFADLVKAAGAKTLRIAHHGASGNDYLHLVAASGQYIPIKIGKKLTNLPEDKAAMAKHLVTEAVIYCGETENGMWFTFGPEPSGVATFEISLAALLKGTAIAKSLVG